MAQITKEEKMAQQAIANQRAWNEFRASYPERFAALMYEFMTLGEQVRLELAAGFNVKKLDANTYLFEGGVSYTTQAKVLVTLSIEPMRDYVWEFETLESVVEEYYERVAEEARKAAIKREALEKVRNTLNAEEMKLLGL